MDIDGKSIAKQIRSQIKESVENIAGRKPCLAVILVGDNPASQIYVKRKISACKEAGIVSKMIRLLSEVSQEELVSEIKKLNLDESIDGILVQLPLPDHINSTVITRTISSNKDVDGFHPVNVGKLLIGEVDGFISCTPLGIQRLLKATNTDVSGKHVVIIGRSCIVGKPMAAMLMQNADMANATVTVAHSRTKNLKELSASADILIVAIGRPHFVTKEMVKDGAVVIDVGINRVNSNQLVGDVDYENVKDKCALITPVPGGVGPMTIAMLLENTLKSYNQQQ